MRMAYADPPYLGQGVKHYGDRHDEATVYDTLDGHRSLIGRLVADFPDGWALSLSAPSLRHILPLCPEDCRVGVWVKPFAFYKPGISPSYAWEPVIWRGGRTHEKSDGFVRDWCRANVPGQRREDAGFPGRKPLEFCAWLFHVLNLRPGDELVDLFPGSGAVGRAWAKWCRDYEGLFPSKR